MLAVSVNCVLYTLLLIMQQHALLSLLDWISMSPFPEIDMEGTVTPDTDPPQEMGDPSIEVWWL